LSFDSIFIFASSFFFWSSRFVRFFFCSHIYKFVNCDEAVLQVCFFFSLLASAKRRVTLFISLKNWSGLFLDM
jgi:hypothetical protein